MASFNMKHSSSFMMKNFFFPEKLLGYSPFVTAGNLSKNLQYVGYFPYLLYLLSESIKHRKLKLINSFQRSLHKKMLIANHLRIKAGTHF